LPLLKLLDSFVHLRPNDERARRELLALTLASCLTLHARAFASCRGVPSAAHTLGGGEHGGVGGDASPLIARARAQWIMDGFLLRVNATLRADDGRRCRQAEMVRLINFPKIQRGGRVATSLQFRFSIGDLDRGSRTFRPSATRPKGEGSLARAPRRTLRAPATLQRATKCPPRAWSCA